MAKIEHVFFDLDHTLWDFEKNSDLTFQKIFLKHNLEIDIATFLKVYKPLNRSFWKLYREEKISKEDLRYQRLKTAFDAINYEISDTLIHIIADEYINYLPDFNHLFEGTFEITSESVGVKKPDPKVFKHALQQANAKEENSIMIGDSVEADILGAINSGIPAIHCNFENEVVENTNFKSISSLLEIKQYL